MSSSEDAALKPALVQSGLRWWPLGVAALALDQITKAWIHGRLQQFESITVLPVFDIVHARNPGAAFSFLAGQSGWQRWFFTVFALVMSVAILVWLRRTWASHQKLQSAALMLIVSGALGNVIDRIRFGYVIDFVHVHWGAASFPAFNVADSCISIGAGLMLLDAFLDSRRQRLQQAGNS
jgi:signal peptidase II